MSEREDLPPKPLTAATLQAAQEALLKAEPWRSLPERWQAIFRSYEDMRLAKMNIYAAGFPEFSRDLQAAGGRDSEGGKAVIQQADREWQALTGLPTTLCNKMAWYDAAVAAGYRPADADKITFDAAERAVRHGLSAWWRSEGGAKRRMTRTVARGQRRLSATNVS